MEFEEGSSVGGGIEDRRGMGRGALAGGGGLLGLVGVVVALLFGNPLGGGDGTGFGIPTPGLQEETAPGGPSELSGASCKAGTGPNGSVEVFTACAFGDAQRTWRSIFSASGSRYRDSTLVLYEGQTSTACGVGSSAAGPFYCPADEKVYLDTSFFRQLKAELGAPGDFAAAYVIAHEVGHHVQKVVGTSDQVRRLQASKPSRENELSVRLELQADCYAGVWAKEASDAGTIRLDADDPAEALRAAAQIGDDRLRRSAGRAVNPESFTHGSSAQRRRWLDKGLATGDPSACDTFSGSI